MTELLESGEFDHTFKSIDNLCSPLRWLRRVSQRRVALAATRDSASPLLWIVEGIHDIHFLKAIGAVLRRSDSSLPDLDALEAERRLLFVPFGGSDPRPWVTRLAPLGLPDLHLYDREFPPVTGQRQTAVEAVNRRPGCRAFLTGPPNLESYLHPAAIWTAGQVRVELWPDDDVVEAVARTKHQRRHGPDDWSRLPARNRKRLRDGAKHWLNTTAVGHMTPELLAERDPAGDIRRWLAAVVELSG